MDKMSLFPEFSTKMDADALQVAMDELGLDGVTLAERLDLNPKTIYRWLDGAEIPAAVALLLNVAHAALMFTHSWSGPGLGVDAAQAKRVPAKVRGVAKRDVIRDVPNFRGYTIIS